MINIILSVYVTLYVAMFILKDYLVTLNKAIQSDTYMYIISLAMHTQIYKYNDYNVMFYNSHVYISL